MKQTRAKLPSGVHAILWREGRWYVAKCIEVEVASQGKTKKQAIANLEEALALYFDETSLPRPPVFQNVELHTVRIAYA